MKKLLALTLAMTMTISSTVLANSPAKPVLISTEVEAQVPLMAIDRETFEEIYMARPTAEKMGYTVTWNNDERAIIFTLGNNVLKATVNSNVYVVNGEKVELETKTAINKDRAYIPASFVNILNDCATKPAVITSGSGIETTTGSGIEIATIDSIVTALNGVEAAEIIGSEIGTQMSTILEDILVEYKEYESFFGEKIDLSGLEVGYEILSKNDEYVSVLVYMNENLNEDTYITEYYAVFGAKTGEFVQISEILGDDYAKTVKETVIANADQIEGLFDIENMQFEIVSVDTPFYINENGDVVIVFSELEISTDEVEVIISVK